MKKGRERQRRKYREMIEIRSLNKVRYKGGGREGEKRRERFVKKEREDSLRK